MTSLASWLGVDERGPTSLYVVSDSRISWGSSATWDHGRKVFACGRTPDLFGYCGDVVFPSLALGQACEMVNAGVLFTDADSSEARHVKLRAVLENAFSSYPAKARSGFVIIHCSRDGEGMESSFNLWQIEWSKKHGWSSRKLVLPNHSDLLVALGSGKRSVKVSHFGWQKSEVRRTSRSVFSAFADSLASGLDPLSGGPPQLAGLYRKGAGQIFGVVSNGQRYYYGLPVSGEVNLSGVEWRNELFERCDGETLKLLEGAQRHARPNSLK